MDKDLEIKKFEAITFFPNSIISNLDDYALFFIESGNVEINLHKKIILQKNNIILSTPLSPIPILNTSESSTILYVLTFNGSQAKKYIELWGVDRSNPFADITQIRENVKACYENASLSNDEKIKDIVYRKNFLHLTELFYSLNKNVKNSEIKSLNRYTSLVIKYLDTHFSFADLSLKSIASYIHIDVKYLSKIIKKDLNCTFTTLLTQKRIDTAKKILEESNTPITQIALSVGFSDSFYFSRTFKKYTGSSPSEYRKFSQKNIEHTVYDLKGAENYD